MIETEKEDILIKKIDFLQALQESNFTFERDFLFSIILDLQTHPEDMSPDAILAYSKLQEIIDLYSKAPVVDKGDGN